MIGLKANQTPQARDFQVLCVKIVFMIIVYGIPLCDKVKKVRAWLAEQGLLYIFHDFKKQGVPVDKLSTWASSVGWDRLLNRQGTTWRKLDAAIQASTNSPQGLQTLMVKNPSVIKRPVVEWQNGDVTVGFDSDTWTAVAAK